MSKADDVRKFLDCVIAARTGFRIGDKTDRNPWAWAKRRKPPRNHHGLDAERERLWQLARRLRELTDLARDSESAHIVWKRLVEGLLKAFARTKHRMRLMLVFGEGQKFSSGAWKEFVLGLCPKPLPTKGSRTRNESNRRRLPGRLSESLGQLSGAREKAAPVPNFRPAEHFQKRLEYDEAHHIFSGGLKEGSVVRLHLRGFRWNGKREIARKLAAEFGARHFPGGRTEVQLKGSGPERLSVRQALTSIVHQYTGEPGPLPESEEALRQMWLRALGGRKSLLILLDADETHDLTWLLPPEKSSWVIVTSEREIQFNSSHAIEVGGLAPIEASNLAVLLGTKRGITHDIARKLVVDLGGHPGSISELMKTICHQLIDVTIEEILTDLAQDPWQLLSPFVRVLELKYSGLPDSEQQMWKRLAVFPSDFEAHAAVAVAGDPLLPRPATKILSQLRNWGCVQFAPEERRYELDPLHRKFLRDTKLTKDERRDLEKAHATYYFSQVAHRAVSRSNRPMLSLAEGHSTRESANIATAFLWASSCGQSERCLRFVKDAHRSLFYGLRVQTTIGWAEQALQCADDSDDYHALGLATHLLAVGRAWQARHDDATTLYQRAQAYLEKVHNKDDAWWNDILLIKAGIAWVLNDNGDDGATKLFYNCLRDIKHKQRSGYVPEVMMYAFVVEGLAESFLRRSRPRPRLAIHCYNQLRQLLRPDPLVFERRYYAHLIERGLGWSWSLLNHHDKAEKHLRRAVDLARDMHQGPKGVVSIGKLGFAQFRAGTAEKLASALDNLEEGYELATTWQLFGYAAEICLDRCRVLFALGKRDDAVKNAHELMESCKDLQFPRIVNESRAWLKEIGA